MVRPGDAATPKAPVYQASMPEAHGIYDHEDMRYMATVTMPAQLRETSATKMLGPMGMFRQEDHGVHDHDWGTYYHMTGGYGPMVEEHRRLAHDTDFNKHTSSEKAALLQDFVDHPHGVEEALLHPVHELPYYDQHYDEGEGLITEPWVHP